MTGYVDQPWPILRWVHWCSHSIRWHTGWTERGAKPSLRPGDISGDCMLSPVAESAKRGELELVIP